MGRNQQNTTFSWKAFVLLAVLFGFYAGQVEHGIQEAFGIAHHADHELGCQLCDICLSAHDIPLDQSLPLPFSFQRFEQSFAITKLLLENISTTHDGRAPPGSST